MSYVADVLCACDAIQPKSSMGVPEDHPALFSPKNAAPKQHAKLHESRILSTGESGSYLCLLREMIHINGVDVGLTSTQA